MARGSIYFDEEFKFSDGTTGKKLFIVLNDPVSDESLIIIKTTSKSKQFSGAVSGCNPDKKVFFVRHGSGSSFDKDTYIQFQEFYEISVNEFAQDRLTNKTIKYLADLPPLLFAQILNCLKRIKEDISEVHYEMIFRK